MGVTKTIIKEGSGAVAQKGQAVTIEYTGWLKDTTQAENKGKQYVPKLPATLPLSRSSVEYMN